MTEATGVTPRYDLLRHLPEMVTVSDRRGRIVYANPATEHVSGYRPEEFVTMDPFSQMHPEDRTRCEDAFAKLLHSPGLILELEHRVRHKDGSWRWVEGTFANRFDDPEVGGLLATVRDITGRKRIEEALRESEERQAFLLEFSDMLRPLADAEAVMYTACRLMVEHLGASRAQYNEVEGEPGAEVGEVRGEFVRVGEPMPRRFPLDVFCEWPMGVLRRGEVLIMPDTDKDPRLNEAQRAAFRSVGSPAAVSVPLVKEGRLSTVFTVHDLEPRDWTAAEVELVREIAERTWAAVERACAEAALAESEAQYRTLFASIDEGFCTIEVLFDERDEPADYRFLETNPAFERQTGIEDGVGRTMRELAPEHEDFWFEVYGRIARTGEAMRFEHEAAALGRYYDVYAFRIGEPEENLLGVIFNDILPRKRAEDERERLGALEASIHAEAAERERISRELHDRVAHTMGVAHQALELHSVLAERAPKRAAEKLELAREATRTALDQTRDLSAQLARRGMDETSDGLGAALSELLASYVPDGVETALSVEGDESTVSAPLADETYLIMREAVRNAVEHSGCGRVAVSVEVRDGILRGRVEDDGRGFNSRGSSDAEEAPTPAGVGTGSMRERAELLGGRLELDSKPGSGTVVEARIPLAE